MTNRAPMKSVTDLALENPVTLKQIVAWITNGDLEAVARQSDGEWAPTWFVPNTELPVLHALIEGRTPVEARAERDALIAHLGERTIHTPVGTPVSDEELAMRRLRGEG